MKTEFIGLIGYSPNSSYGSFILLVILCLLLLVLGSWAISEVLQGFHDRSQELLLCRASVTIRTLDKCIDSLCTIDSAASASSEDRLSKYLMNISQTLTRGLLMGYDHCLDQVYILRDEMELSAKECADKVADRVIKGAEFDRIDQPEVTSWLRTVVRSVVFISRDELNSCVTTGSADPFSVKCQFIMLSLNSLLDGCPSALRDVECDLTDDWILVSR